METDLLTRYADETERILWYKAGTDATRNAAVLLLFAMILAVFGLDQPTGHRALYAGSFAVFALTLFEARLFRLGAASRQRVALLDAALPSLLRENQTLTGVLRGPLPKGFAHPSTPSFLEAVAHRIYRSHFLIFLAIDTAWLSKVYLSPTPAQSGAEMVDRLRLGAVAGWFTVGFVVLFWAGFIWAVLYTRKAKKQKHYLNGY